MIVYDKLWSVLERKKISLYALREIYGIDKNTLKRLKRNQNITVKTLNKLCAILNCRLEEIAEYIPDDPQQKA